MLELDSSSADDSCTGAFGLKGNEGIHTMTEVATGPDQLETWENISRSRYVLKKFSAKGDLAPEMINGLKKFHISTRERHINQELTAEASLDPFSNGMFVPVRLLETTDDAEQIASNPNVIGESEMAELVKGKVDALKKRLADIENPIVLRRLLDVAEESDVQASKITAIKGRLEEVEPQTHVELDQPSIR